MTLAGSPKPHASLNTNHGLIRSPLGQCLEYTIPVILFKLPITGEKIKFKKKK